jgi:hypothetical protein
MNKRARRHGNLFLFASLMGLFIFPLGAAGQGALSENIDTAEFAQVRIEKLQQAAKTLQGLAGQPLPENLADEEKTEAMKYTRWLIASGRKLDELAQRWQNRLSDIGMIQSRVTSQKQIRETNTSFKLQYWKLRDTILRESGQFGLVPYIMKDNYAMARSSIKNLR